MQNNKLIAEFMGIVYPKLNNVIVIDNVVIKENELQYDTSWGWLMPVVEKIEEELEEEFRVVILEHECSIHQKTEDQKLQTAFQCVVERFATSKIEATYDAVVEFIKQYNDATSNNTEH